MTTTLTAPPARTASRVPRLRPYQAAIAQAILTRIVAREGGSISVEIARHGGKTELDPLLRRVARKRLIRTAAMRRRDRLILAILGHHTHRDLLTGVRTDIAWAPALAPHLAAAPEAASA